MTEVLDPPSEKPGTTLASEQEAREVAEAAREQEWQAPSFVRSMFEGSFRLDLIHPFPRPNPADLARPVDSISVIRSKSGSGNTPSIGAFALKLR